LHSTLEMQAVSIKIETKSNEILKSAVLLNGKKLNYSALSFVIGNEIHLDIFVPFY